MPGYWDAQQGSTDLQLLPSHLRADENLATLSEVVEADIVARYTVSTADAPAYAWTATPWGWTLDTGPAAGMVKLADNLYIRLRGYAPDAADAEAYFAAAMRREIAHVLRWRLGQAKRDPSITQESTDDRSKTYRDDAAEPFPATFPLYLRPFVVDDGAWALG